MFVMARDRETLSAATVKGRFLAQSQKSTSYLGHLWHVVWQLRYSSTAHRPDLSAALHQEEADLAVARFSSFLMNLFWKPGSVHPIHGHVQFSVISI
jgi:hypothetical protein